MTFTDLLITIFESVAVVLLLPLVIIKFIYLKIAGESCAL